MIKIVDYEDAKKILCELMKNVNDTCARDINTDFYNAATVHYYDAVKAKCVRRN